MISIWRISPSEATLARRLSLCNRSTLWNGTGELRGNGNSLRAFILSNPADFHLSNGSSSGQPHFSKNSGMRPGARSLEPAVAESEEETGVETRIEMAEAGVGVMDELDFEIPGAARARENVEAESGL